MVENNRDISGLGLRSIGSGRRATRDHAEDENNAEGFPVHGGPFMGFATMHPGDRPFFLAFSAGNVFRFELAPESTAKDIFS
jgi:hypothetical protein